MSKHIKSYFELHAHEYSRDPRVYDGLAEEIKRAKQDEEIFSVLDMGCGKGNFIRAMIERGLKAHYFGTDISIRMIELAKNNLQSNNIHLLVADGFKVPVKPTFKFDVIHIDSLLHHLVGRSRAKSFCLVKELIEELVSMLSPNGMLIVEEMYYDSYLIPQLTSFIIFYTLKAVNFLKIDLSRLVSLAKPGLEVNFFYKDQLLSVLNEYGFAYRFSKEVFGVPRYLKPALLRDAGYITFVLTRTKGPSQSARQ